MTRCERTDLVVQLGQLGKQPLSAGHFVPAAGSSWSPSFRGAEWVVAGWSRGLVLGFFINGYSQWSVSSQLDAIVDGSRWRKKIKLTVPENIWGFLSRFLLVKSVSSWNSQQKHPSVVTKRGSFLGRRVTLRLELKTLSIVGKRAHFFFRLGFDLAKRALVMRWKLRWSVWCGGGGRSFWRTYRFADCSVVLWVFRADDDGLGWFDFCLKLCPSWFHQKNKNSEKNTCWCNHGKSNDFFCIFKGI